jgi:hypothetical protein
VGASTEKAAGAVFTSGYEADVFFGTDRRNRAAERFVRENHAVSWNFSPVPERPQTDDLPARRGSGPTALAARSQ